ncbi:glycoside hydrolase family 3 N-terminal domain-containing protein [Paenibacillus sp.]|uniref:glycoside hydrolase family 3 N-terminal domain-containing protein n=1 Tax=Paenibacillus sp. TaxID=58172 RepID=UPI002D626B9E|nr:glycoside hydrolase family 3 N-terminal domain-containing protein [Paenibacillus sp.]HZG56456.1 glycoside hydrolase family 3 N-terminal domain-containing protein [Paenibacillus sp.]
MRKIYERLLKIGTAALVFCGGWLPSTAGHAEGFPYQDATLPVEQRVADLLSRMTLEEKIGQMLQVERLTATPEQVRDHTIGSVLSGGGSNPSPNTPTAWADETDSFQAAALQTRLQIPILYGVDAVHGHNNVYGATIFPHNVGLGAAGDPDLARRAGAITAKEVRATGIQWSFSPCLCAPQDIRWGRTYEGYSENVTLAGLLGAAYTEGLQGAPGEPGFLKGTKVAGSAKHWLGDGNTTGGDDQGEVTLTEEELDPYIQPYKEAIAAGVRTVMVSLSTWNGMKAHTHHRLITGMLKQELGFTGIVVSDWNGTYALVNQGVYPTYAEALKATVNAGIDLFMEPDHWQQFAPTLLGLVQGNEVSTARIDDAVSRILRVKFEAGLFEAPYADRGLLQEGTFGGAAHRAVAREAVRKSATLLKNENRLLPLSKSARVFVAGKKAHDIGYQSGGWTITWQGSPGPITPGTTILEGIQAAVANPGNVTYAQDGFGASGHDVAIVVIGEEPSAEMIGDVGPGQPRPDLELAAEDIELLNNVKSAGVPMVVVLLSGRPMIVTNALPEWSAFVAAWLPGTEGAGLADVLFGDYDFTGKLPFTWPRSMDRIPANSNDAASSPLFPFGYGLNGSPSHTKEAPGFVEAENFNAAAGVQTEASTDVNGSLNVGYIDPADWMEYRLNVPAAGAYRIRLRVASPNGANDGIALRSGATTLATVTVPPTGGWQSWTTVAQTVTLAEGVQTIRVQAEAGGWNLNWLEVIPAGPESNLLANPSFETAGASGWEQWNGDVLAQSVDADQPYSGSQKLTHWASSPYKQLTRQTLAVPDGVYRLSAWARSGGGQKAIRLYAKSGGRERSSEIASGPEAWRKYVIDRIQVVNGQLEVGVWSDAHANQWAAFDHFELSPANLLANSGLESGDAAGWSEWHSGELAMKADMDQPKTGSYKLTFWGASPYQQLASQTLSVPNGTYRFAAWVRSGGGQQALHLFAKQYGGSEVTAAIGSNPVPGWTYYSISGIQVTSGRIEVGVWADAGANQWAAFDDFTLIRQ